MPKYFIHKIEKDRGRCVLELETASIEDAASYIASFFKTDGTYYIFSADGYDGLRYTLRRAGSDATTRKTLDRWKVQIKRVGRWFTIYDGYNRDTAEKIYNAQRWGTEKRFIKKRVPRQPWHR